MNNNLSIEDIRGLMKRESDNMKRKERDFEMCLSSDSETEEEEQENKDEPDFRTLRLLSQQMEAIKRRDEEIKKNKLENEKARQMVYKMLEDWKMKSNLIEDKK
jgi:hypothetical protein